MNRSTLNPTSSADVLHAWRHPRARATDGRCIGQTDVSLDPRKAKRLATNIAETVREFDLPRIVVTSPLQRCADVGRCLRSWGWQHRIDPLLLEMHFGAWDGQLWRNIARTDIDAWCADFLHYAPRGGESLQQVFQRALQWQPGDARVVIAHAGWILARQWLEQSPHAPPTAQQWPHAPCFGARVQLPAAFARPCWM